MHISSQIHVFTFFRYIPICRISASYSIFLFWRISILFSTVATWIYTTVHKGSLFTSTSLPILVTSCLFNNNHFNRYEMISHSSFDLYVLENLWCWPSFLVPVGHAYVFLGKMSIKIPCPFFNQIVFCYWVVQVLYILGILTPYLIHDLQISSPTLSNHW